MLIRVYSGPTISAGDARVALEGDRLPPGVRADYHPPIRHDDLPLAVAEGVDVAVIIDAAFVHTLTATPTQILQCLRLGMRFWGAASAGALRAVECEPWGMRGVGKVYELYRDGFEAEDEICVAFDPETGRALSEAMLNVRVLCADAVALGVIAAATGAAAQHAAKELFFAHRSWPAILHRLRSAGVAGEDVAALEAHVAARGRQLDQKRLDALACLALVRAEAERSSAHAVQAAHPGHAAPAAPADRGLARGVYQPAVRSPLHAAARPDEGITGTLTEREVVAAAAAGEWLEVTRLAVRDLEAAPARDVDGAVAALALALEALDARRDGLLAADMAIQACQHVALSGGVLTDALLGVWSLAYRQVGEHSLAARLSTCRDGAEPAVA